MKLYAVIDRIEDDKVVVINFVDKKGSLYLSKNVFDFPIYEGLWLKIEFLPDTEKSQKTKLQITKLQKMLLSRNKKK